MSGDLSSLVATCSALKDTEKQMQGVVDLLAVDKQVRINTWRCGKWCLLQWITVLNPQHCLFASWIGREMAA